MKTAPALFAVALTLSLAATAPAQIFGRRGEPKNAPAAEPGRFNPPGPSRLFGRAPKATPKDSAPRDPGVLRTGEAVPDPDLDRAQAPEIPAPSVPIENFLLQKEQGPFMVLAYTFTGPEAAKYAQILAMELRGEYHLASYVWLAKVQPMRSNVQGVPPTAPPHARNGDMAPPEKFRTFDEAAVLVGNCKSIDEAESLLKSTVKRIRPRCLDQFPVIYLNRKGKGLSRAIVTTNPFQASQNLYPGDGPAPAGIIHKQGQVFDPFVAAAAFAVANPKVDPMLVRWNGGPHSLFKNPSAYTLQVAEYGGRSAVTLTTQKGFEASLPDDTATLKNSPLVTAAEDAEKLAEALNKCRSMGGMKAYVFHTRTNSVVTVGGFNSPRDANARAIVEQAKLQKVSDELLQRGFSKIALTPAAELMAVPKTTK